MRKFTIDNFVHCFLLVKRYDRPEDGENMLKISRLIDTVNTIIGKASIWLILVSIAISAVNATMRFTVDKASNAALESQWMLFSAAFLLCAPWTLLLNEHIRIDILSTKMRPKMRYIIDIIGHAFVLIPFCAYMIYFSYFVALKSIRINEQSFNAGGLPQWPAKALIPIAFSLLLLQAISELIKRINVYQGKIDEPYKNLSSHAPLEDLGDA